MVTTPPEVVRILASSTVLVKASSLVNRDLGGILGNVEEGSRSLLSWRGGLVQSATSSQLRSVGLGLGCLDSQMRGRRNLEAVKERLLQLRHRENIQPNRAQVESVRWLTAKVP